LEKIKRRQKEGKPCSGPRVTDEAFQGRPEGLKSQSDTGLKWYTTFPHGGILRDAVKKTAKVSEGARQVWEGTFGKK